MNPSAQVAGCCCGPGGPPTPLGTSLTWTICHEQSHRMAQSQQVRPDAQVKCTPAPNYVHCASTTTNCETIYCPDFSEYENCTTTPIEGWTGAKGVTWSCIYNVTQGADIELNWKDRYPTSYNNRPAFPGGPVSCCQPIMECLRAPAVVVGTFNCTGSPCLPGVTRPIYGNGSGLFVPGPVNIDIESHVKACGTYTANFSSLSTFTSGPVGLRFRIGGVVTATAQTARYKQVTELYNGSYTAPNQVNTCTRNEPFPNTCQTCAVAGGTTHTHTFTASYGRTSTYASDVVMNVSRTDANTWTVTVAGSITFTKNGTTNYPVSKSGTLQDVATRINAIGGLSCSPPTGLSGVQGSEIKDMALTAMSPTARLYLRKIGDAWDDYQVSGREYFAAVGGAFGGSYTLIRPDTISRQDWQYGVATYYRDSSFCGNVCNLGTRLPYRLDIPCCTGSTTPYTGYQCFLDVPPTAYVRSIQTDQLDTFTAFNCNYGNLADPKAVYCGPCSEAQRQFGFECMKTHCSLDWFDNICGLEGRNNYCDSDPYTPACSLQSSVPCFVTGTATATGFRYQWQVRRA